MIFRILVEPEVSICDGGIVAGPGTGRAAPGNRISGDAGTLNTENSSSRMPGVWKQHFAQLSRRNAMRSAVVLRSPEPV